MAFYEVRRKDRLMDHGDIERLISEGEYGIFSTIGDNGYPYGVPVNYCYCDGKLYFHGARAEGHKYANAVYREKVCFTIVGKTQIVPSQFSINYESVVIFGTVRVIDGISEKSEVLKALIHKYSSSFEKEGMDYIGKAVGNTLVYEITPEQITGKSRRQ